MLVQFTVGNYLSFGPETTFSMRATNDARHPRHVVQASTGSGKTLALLRAAALYGANAAGKSNLVVALAFAQKLILDGTHGENSIPVRPFKLGQAADGPSRFEFIFLHQGVLYSYGFAVCARRVHEEWLFATERNEKRCFERVTDEAGKTQVEFGPAFKKAVGGRRLNFIAQGTRPNQLLLTECAERNVEAVKPIMDWFRDVLLPLHAESQWAPLPMAIRLDESIKQFTCEFLRVAGTGIEDVEAEEVALDANQLLAWMDEDDRRALESLESTEGLLITGEQGRHLMIVRGRSGEPCLLQIHTLHRNAAGELVRFRMEEESEGTQRLFHLIPALFGLKHEPRVVVIDELDRRLHTLLTRLFLQQALECGENDAPGQFIFTTHDTNLLDLDLLRRDEIWFVEKDSAGASHLASLAEWKVRPDLEIEKGYLNGRFGAVPFFGDVNRLLCLPDGEVGEAGGMRHGADTAQQIA